MQQPAAHRILIVGELNEQSRSHADALAADYHISAAPNVLDAAKRCQSESFSAIIFDLVDERLDLAELLHTLQNLSPNTPILVVSEFQQADLIVSAVKAGATDFVTKPIVGEKLKLSLQKALENRSLRNEIDYLRREQDVVYAYDRIIAVSPAMQAVMATIQKMSRNESTILVTGETGTGKSFLSGTIHFNSPRRRMPFIKVNCANIPETLLESELFGHEKGAFTGADKTRSGRFEQANGGTIFLDEFCELGFGLQAKLLRALEDKSFERLGGNKTIRSDTRIIAATNRDIENQVREGKFREDLYYRINVLRIHLPPLRERKECIEPLAYYLLNKLSRSLKKRVDAFAPEVLEALIEYQWPGNVRQLSNTIERAILLEDTRTIRPENVSLPDVDKPPAQLPPPPASLKLSSDEEKQLIFEALKDNLWIQKDAARQLGISPRALNYRIKKLGIAHPRWRINK